MVETKVAGACMAGQGPWIAEEWGSVVEGNQAVVGYYWEDLQQGEGSGEV